MSLKVHRFDYAMRKLTHFIAGIFFGGFAVWMLYSGINSAVQGVHQIKQVKVDVEAVWDKFLTAEFCLLFGLLFLGITILSFQIYRGVVPPGEATLGKTPISSGFVVRLICFFAAGAFFVGGHVLSFVPIVPVWFIHLVGGMTTLALFLSFTYPWLFRLCMKRNTGSGATPASPSALD